jgi:hypothetical protein
MKKQADFIIYVFFFKLKILVVISQHLSRNLFLFLLTNLIQLFDFLIVNYQHYKKNIMILKGLQIINLFF